MKEFFKKINYKRLLARIGIVTGVTVLFLLIALFAVLCIINYGPSKRAHKVFVKSVRETSAIGFLADWFTTKAELEQILQENTIEEIQDTTETNLIHIPTKAPDQPEGKTEPEKIIQYLEDDNRPQVSLDVDYENGYGISIGRLREDSYFDWKFVGLSHNTVRGAAGGGVLMAELLKAKGFRDKK